jgi:hypothetical protein
MSTADLLPVALCCCCARINFTAAAWLNAQRWPTAPYVDFLKQTRLTRQTNVGGRRFQPPANVAAVVCVDPEVLVKVGTTRTAGVEIPGRALHKTHVLNILGVGPFTLVAVAPFLLWLRATSAEICMVAQLAFDNLDALLNT